MKVAAKQHRWNRRAPRANGNQIPLLVLISLSIHHLTPEIQAQGSGQALFSIGIVDRRPNPVSGLWWSDQGNPDDRPRLEIQYTQEGQARTQSYQYGLNGMENGQAIFIRPVDDCGDGTSHCHKHNILVKKNPVRHGFFRADISDIPPGARIDSVKLWLHFHETEGLANAEKSGALEVFAVERDWHWDEITWTRYAAGRNWTTPGGDFGRRIREIRIDQDILAHGWRKSNPRGSLDFTDYVRDLQAARGGGDARNRK